MLPGFSAELMPKGREKESQAKIKRYMTMMDSMTNEGKLFIFSSKSCYFASNSCVSFDKQVDISIKDYASRCGGRPNFCYTTAPLHVS